MLKQSRLPRTSHCPVWVSPKWIDQYIRSMPEERDWRSTWPDSPVLPPDPSARYGEGHERAIVISGGGLAGLAWGSAYLNGLVNAGIDLSKADLVVGSGEGSPAKVRVYLGSNFTGTGEPGTFQDINVFGGAALADGVYVG